MSTIGLKKIEATSWSASSSGLLIKKFKGKATQWRAKNLRAVRKELRNEVLLLQRYRCAYCRRQLGEEIGKHEIDHVLPSSIHPFFTYTKINLVATCKRCNWLKREHDPRVNLAKITMYPMTLGAWKWVHPYIHDYDDHIEILGGLIFRPRRKTGPRKNRAKNLIAICGLDEIKHIEKRAAFETACSWKNEYQAAFNLAASYPKVSATVLAHQLIRAFPGTGDLLHFKETILNIRTAAATQIINAMAKGKSPSAR